MAGTVTDDIANGHARRRPPQGKQGARRSCCSEVVLLKTTMVVVVEVVVVDLGDGPRSIFGVDGVLVDGNYGSVPVFDGGTVTKRRARRPRLPQRNTSVEVRPRGNTPRAAILSNTWRESMARRRGDGSRRRHEREEMRRAMRRADARASFRERAGKTRPRDRATTGSGARGRQAAGARASSTRAGRAAAARAQRGSGGQIGRAHV